MAAELHTHLKVHVAVFVALKHTNLQRCEQKRTNGEEARGHSHLVVPDFRRIGILHGQN